MLKYNNNNKPIFNLKRHAISIKTNLIVKHSAINPYTNITCSIDRDNLMCFKLLFTQH